MKFILRDGLVHTEKIRDAVKDLPFDILYFDDSLPEIYVSAGKSGRVASRPVYLTIPVEGPLKMTNFSDSSVTVHPVVHYRGGAGFSISYRGRDYHYHPISYILENFQREGAMFEDALRRHKQVR